MLRRHTLTTIVLLAVGVFATSTHGTEADGRADRLEWEHWIGTLRGPAWRGAYFWASQRSLAQPGSCTGPTSNGDPAFVAGCVEAMKRIALPDVRRKNEPDYKVGWNAPVDLGPAVARDCRLVADDRQRLACFDNGPIADPSRIALDAPAAAPPTPAPPKSPPTPTESESQVPTTRAHASAATLGPRDVEQIYRRYQDNLEGLMKSQYWLAPFEATGLFGKFTETLPAKLWSVSVLVPGASPDHVGCFYDRFDRNLAALSPGTRVRIAGTVGAVAAGVFLLAGNCSVSVD